MEASVGALQQDQEHCGETIMEGGKGSKGCLPESHPSVATGVPNTLRLLSSGRNDVWEHGGKGKILFFLYFSFNFK